jgi:ABC-2 type transport system permease protein
MGTMNSGLAVFLWTFRRKWKGLSIFIASVGLLILVIINVYPEFSELRGKAIAKALGGDIEISLTRNDETDGDYTLTWSKFGGADGYAVVQSNREIPLSLIKGMDVPQVNLRLLELLPSGGTITVHTFDASTTSADFTVPEKKPGEEVAPVYFCVVAFTGSVSNAKIEGASDAVNTKQPVAKGAYDKLMKHPLMKTFIGDLGVDMYSVKGFMSFELFSSLTLFIIIYFLVQYGGAFSSEMENRTIDLILSTPLSRRRLFISRYLSWLAVNLIVMASWTFFMHAGVVSIGKSAEAPLADIAQTTFLFLPFALTVQGFCMLASVAANDSRKAYGITFGVYYGMYFLRIISVLSERLSFLRYFTIFQYWDYNSVFVGGVVRWGGIALLTFLSIGLFVAGVVVFERKDLAL